MKTKIGLNDLTLLVETARLRESGYPELIVWHGFKAAADRLERVGLIERNPTGPNYVVRITVEGQNVIDQMLNVLAGVVDRRLAVQRDRC